MELEVIKIGKVLPPIMNKSKTIMIVNNGGEIIDFYVNKLMNQLNSEFTFIKSEKSLIGILPSFSISIDNLPNIGEDIANIFPRKLSIGFLPSKVVKIIDNQIIITDYSVYALHNQSNIRESRLNDLGI